MSGALLPIAIPSLTSAYSALHDALAGRYSKTIGPNTTLRQRHDNKITVRLYSTDILTVTRQTVTINSGGHRTLTTKNRLNALLNDSGYAITQKNNTWYINGVLYYDNFTIVGE